MLDELIASARDLERAGAWDQALARYEEALVRLPRDGTAARAAELLRWIGTVHRQRGELELAGEAYEVSLTVAELNALDYHHAAVLNCLGAVEYQRGDVDRAEALYARALDLAVSIEDHQLAACLDQNLGALHSLRGDLLRALGSYEAVLARSRGLADDHLATRALTNIGIVQMDIGNWEAAESAFEEAFRLAESAGEILMMGTLELSMAGVHLQQKRWEQARACCDRSLEVFGRLRSKYWTAEAFKFYGILHRETQAPDQAGACFALAIGLAEVAQNALLQAEAQMEWAIVHLEAGRDQEGIMYLNRALRLFGEMQARREVLDIQERLEKMESLYLPAVQKWSAELLGRTNPAHVSHASRVADLSCLLARELGLEGWDLTVVHVGALIHDIGYTTVPPMVAAVADRNSEGHALLRVHAVAGDVLAKRLDFPVEVRSIVRSHHERLNGSGYPDQLVGQFIPVATRIVSVADAFDHLVNPDPRQPRRSRAEAVATLRSAEGAFDTNVLDALERVAPLELTSAQAA